MIVASLLNALSGLLLYWTVSGHLQGAWITSGPGLMLTIGLAAGLLAFVIGNVVNGPTAKQIAALGQEVQTAGGTPTPAQMDRMQALIGDVTEALAAYAGPDGLAYPIEALLARARK